VSEPVNLAYLYHHYGEAYEVNADALLDLIRADYAAHPVSRRIAESDRPETPARGLVGRAAALWPCQPHSTAIQTQISPGFHNKLSLERNDLVV
jgi:hypothetical protein